MPLPVMCRAAGRPRLMRLLSRRKSTNGRPSSRRRGPRSNSLALDLLGPAQFFRTNSKEGVLRMTTILRVAAMLGVALCLCAKAQAFPDRPITVVVPFPPGGATDTTARLMSEKMSELIGQRFVVENKPGAT